MNETNVDLTSQQAMGSVPPGSVPPAGANTGSTKKIILIAICSVVALLVLILLINIIGTRTLKCNSESEFSDITMKSVEKIKFKFGKPYSKYAKITIDYSDSDYDKDDIKDAVKDIKKSEKESCKKSDGCTYSIKQSGKKIIVVEKQKFDKEYKEDFADIYDSFKDFKEDYNDKCDD